MAKGGTHWVRQRVRRTDVRRGVRPFAAVFASRRPESIQTAAGEVAIQKDAIHCVSDPARLPIWSRTRLLNDRPLGGSRKNPTDGREVVKVLRRVIKSSHMTTVVAPPVPPSAAPVPPGPSTGPRRFDNAAEWLTSLGGIPLRRILFTPWPGAATEADLIRLVEQDKRLCELIDGTLVEKPVGLRESAIAARIIIRFGMVVEPGRLGVVTGEAGMIRMAVGNVRMPDVAFFRREDLPDGRLPLEPVPRLAPALAVEVLSQSNTGEEMRIKVREYFDSGVRLVWILDPPTQTLRIYDSPDRFRQLTANDTVETADLLPGFAARVGDLFEV